MGWLGFNEELIHLKATLEWEESEIDSHFDKGEEIERLFGGQ